MELEIIRTYHSEGTNGSIFINGKLQCYCIELPWLENQQQVSCIPEGRYELKKRYSQKFGWHYLVMQVPGRQDILMHPANNALLELKGCIAPVSIITGQGMGEHSRLALEKLKGLVDPAMEKETVFINIKKQENEHYTKSASAHTGVL